MIDIIWITLYYMSRLYIPRKLVNTNRYHFQRQWYNTICFARIISGHVWSIITPKRYSVLYISCLHTIILASSINPHYKVNNHENHQLENPFQNDHFPILILQWYIVSSTTTPYIISPIAPRLYSFYAIPESLHFFEGFLEKRRLFEGFLE